MLNEELKGKKDGKNKACIRGSYFDERTFVIPMPYASKSSVEMLGCLFSSCGGIISGARRSCDSFVSVSQYPLADADEARAEVDWERAGSRLELQGGESGGVGNRFLGTSSVRRRLGEVLKGSAED